MSVSYDPMTGHVLVRSPFGSQIGRWVRRYMDPIMLNAAFPQVYGCLDPGGMFETRLRIVGTWSALLALERNDDLTRALWGPIAFPNEATWDWVSAVIVNEIRSLAPSAAHVLGLSLAVSTQSPITAAQVEEFSRLDPLVREAARTIAKLGWPGSYRTLVMAAQVSVGMTK